MRTKSDISDRYGIEEGKPANCVVLDCSTDKEAVQCQADVLCSVHNGKTLFTRKPPAYMTTMDGFAASSAVKRVGQARDWIFDRRVRQ